MTQVSTRPLPAPVPGVRRALWFVALFVAELACIAVAYQFLVQIECRMTEAQGICAALKSLVARAIVVLAVAVVLLSAHPVARARFLAAVPGWRGWRLIHLAGLAGLLVPLWMADLATGFGAAMGFWLPGGVAAAVGGLFWLAAPAAWGRLARDLGPVSLLVLGIALLIPDLAEAIRPIWDWSVLTTATFVAVSLFLRVFAEVTVADPAGFVIGVQGFAVHISQQCSGVEGLALVTGFVAIYALIFRQSLRLGRFLAVVLPVALLLSWILNVVRIGVLILLGAHVSPEVAVNGFHSYAGWLFFTLLALGLVATVQVLPWLHRDATRPPQPLRRDPVAVLILPFILFMLISTLVAALAPHPDIGYPVKAMALGVVVLAWVPAYWRLPWGMDPLALLAGLAVGGMWVVTAGPGDAELAALLAAMTPAALASWIALRLLGTALLVPVIEEMFFRGYVLVRLDGPPWPRRALAIGISSLLFAVLHDRWIVAFVAGVVFALLALRRGRATDAVQAHVAANLLVGAVAAIRGDFSLI